MSPVRKPIASTPAPPLAVARPLVEDPGLVQDLEGPHLEAAERVAARVITLAPGPWDVQRPRDPAGTLGLLVLEGVIIREVALAGQRCIELLGREDVIRPWDEPDALASLPSRPSWQVIEPARLAVLDRRFALSIARWPEVTNALFERMLVRSRTLAGHLALAHVVRLEVRLLVVLWHVAERWGRVTPEGVVLPLRLSHELLAGMVGARRPSVTVALGRLRREGSVVRQADGSWLLAGPPPAELGELLERDSSPAARDPEAVAS